MIDKSDLDTFISFTTITKQKGRPICTATRIVLGFFCNFVSSVLWGAATMFERRREQRVAITDDEIVVMGRYSNSVGVIKDISMGGMRFEYFSDKPVDGQWKLIDILANRQDHVLLASVPCDIAYDIKGMASNSTFTGLCVRICGVNFNALTEDQTGNLEHLIARQQSC